ncbi:MAG TPA: hypothetical protein VFW21_03850 [Mycobacterium sp.]|nr:hypothetical protein [Mycobacterium sp.]
MGILYGFAPWIVYWVLVGNVPFTTAVLIALAIAIAMFALGWRTNAPGRTLQVGAVLTFVVLTVLTFTLSQAFMERWIQPLSNAGIFAVALAGVLAGKPFVREFAEAGQPPEVVESDLFAQITTRLTWIWVAVFAGMTVSSAIPPILQGDATILDTKTPLSFVFYWVIPFSLLGIGALASRILPDRMSLSPDTVRKTTFVAYSEATIDELYYLAREHATREVGGGQEAYDIKVGGAGVPLVGDESRLSWPSTYKVRERKK